MFANVESVSIKSALEHKKGSSLPAHNSSMQAKDGRTHHRINHCNAPSLWTALALLF